MAEACFSSGVGGRCFGNAKFPLGSLGCPFGGAGLPLCGDVVPLPCGDVVSPRWSFRILHCVWRVIPFVFDSFARIYTFVLRYDSSTLYNESNPSKSLSKTYVFSKMFALFSYMCFLSQEQREAETKETRASERRRTSEGNQHAPQSQQTRQPLK